MRLFMMSLLATLLACGPSPILQHATAGEPTEEISQKLDIKLSTLWVQGPKVGEESVLLAGFTDRNGAVTAVENLKVELWMPDMGHGSAPVKIERQADGTYMIRQIYFIMGGLWEIHFRSGDTPIGTLSITL